MQGSPPNLIRSWQRTDDDVPARSHRGEKIAADGAETTAHLVAGDCATHRLGDDETKPTGVLRLALEDVHYRVGGPDSATTAHGGAEVHRSSDPVRPGEHANGFSFQDYTGPALAGTVARAVAMYGDKRKWKKLVTTGMTQDWSWLRSATEYETVYQRVVEKRRAAFGAAGG